MDDSEHDDSRFMDALLFRRMKGDTTKEEEAIIDEWRRSAPQNEAHFRDVVTLLDITGSAYQLAAGTEVAPRAADLAQLSELSTRSGTVSKKNRERKYGSAEAAKGGSDLAKFYWAIGVVAVLGVGIVGWSVGSKAMSPTVSAPIQVAGLDDPMKLMQMAQGITRGDPNAPVTIIEFGDFQCPACGSFFSSVEPQVDAEFISTGKANFKFMDFPLVQVHPNAFLAARAGRCANDQGKFWPYHDMLYRMQGRWSNLQNPAGDLEGYAKDLGLDADLFSSCLRSDKHADVISASLELATQLQVPSTPTIMIGAGKGGQPRRVTSSIEGIREGVAVIMDELSRARTGG